MDTLYKKWLAIMVVAVYGHTLTAQQIVSKKINETYEMTDAGELYLNNKYGDITIKGWNRNSISISITITVNHKSKESAENLLERIQPNIKATYDFVSANYEIADRSSGFFAKYFEKANPFDYDKTNIQIDYTIHLPVNAELDVNNAFGDIIISDWKGKLKANLEHGDMWLNKSLKTVDINIKYGKLKTKSVSYGTILLKNGSLDLEESKNMTLESSGSEITIGKIASLEVDSSKDEIIIEESGNINGNLKFSKMHLGTLSEKINLTMKITDFKVSKIENAAAVIILNQVSSEINLNITDFHFRFDATLQEGLLRIPKTFKNIDTEIIDKSKRIRKIRATYGTKPTGRISIKGEKGVILLMEI